MKKNTAISICLFFLVFSLNAQKTWGKLNCDYTGFLNMDQYSTATYKICNQEHYVSEYMNVYKFGTTGWTKTQSLSASNYGYDFLVIEEDTVIYAYLNSSNSKVNVVKAKGAYQTTLGSVDFSTRANNYSVKISRSANGILIVTFTDYASDKVKAMTLVNNQWQDLEAVDVTTPAYEYAFSNQNNQPTIAYQDRAASKLYVTQFNGTNWVGLGSPVDPNYIGDFDISQDTDGTLYLVYTNKDNALLLKKWSGTAWVTLSSFPRDAYSTYRGLKLTVSNGIAYTAYNYGSSTYTLGLKKYEGTTLSQVGATSLTSAEISNYSLGSMNGKPFIFYPNTLWAGKMTVSFWENNIWNTIDPKSIAKGITGISTITGTDNTVYTAFKDYDAAGKISVMQYLNGSWGYVGLPGFSSKAGNNTTLSFDANNVLHVFFTGADQTLNGYKYEGEEWVEISQDWTATGQFKDIYAKFSSDNTLYLVCYTGTNNAITNYGYAYMYSAAKEFSYLSNFWTNNISSLQMTLGSDGKPVVAFTDYQSTYKIYVKKLAGSSWTDVTASVINSDGSSEASITTDNNGVIYIGYNSSTSQGYVIKRLQGSNWVSVSTNVSTYSSTFPRLLFNNANELSVFYLERSVLKAKLLKDNVWVDLGNSNFTDIGFNRLSVSQNQGNYYLAHSFFGGFAYQLLQNPITTGISEELNNYTSNTMFYYNNTLYVKESSDIKVFSVIGQEVFSGAGTEITLSGFKPGIYIAKTEKYQCKFIIE